MIAQELAKENISTEMMHIGNKTIRGCFGCGACAKNQDTRCVAKDDEYVNECIQQMKEADGILIGSPVHFSGIAGTMKSFFRPCLLCLRRQWQYLSPQSRCKHRSSEAFWWCEHL